MLKPWLGNLVMRQSIYIEIDSKKVAVVRNPYERVITLYRESWDWIGLSDWVQKNEITPQSELYKDCEYIICLESWKEDLDALGLEPTEKEAELLYKKYSTNACKNVRDVQVRINLDRFELALKLSWLPLTRETPT